MIKKWTLFFMSLTQVINSNAQATLQENNELRNKYFPAAIEKNVCKALSFYPELTETPIHFLFKKHIKGSVMQAQPLFSTLLRSKGKRQYRINISEQFALISKQMPIVDIPDTVMVGWLGHELGHVLDYEGKTNREMIRFGYRYLMHPKFVREAERVADTLAVDRGMGHYIVATKRFILDNADLPFSYKNKIARLYLSPDVILEQVRKLEEKKAQKQPSN